MKDDREAGQARRVTARRQGAKPSVGVKRPEAKKLRVQFHLGETLVERLGVHATLVHRNQSAVVEEVLTSWLSRYGKGKDLFPAGPEELSDPAIDPT